MYLRLSVCVRRVLGQGGGKELGKNISGRRNPCVHAEALVPWVLRSSSGRSLLKPFTLCMGLVGLQLDWSPPASPETYCQPTWEGVTLPWLPVYVTGVMDLHTLLGVFHDIKHCAWF